MNGDADIAAVTPSLELRRHTLNIPDWPQTGRPVTRWDTTNERSGHANRDNHASWPYRSLVYGPLLRNVLLPASDLATGSSIHRTLRQLRREVHLPAAEVERLQTQRLDQLLRHATERTRYYQPYRRHAGDSPQDWLARFPILQKRDLRDNTEALLQRSLPKRLHKASTSGSSGVQSTIFVDDYEMSVTKAVHLLWMEWSGYRWGEPTLQSGAVSRADRSFVKRTKDKLFRTEYYNTLYLSRAHAIEVLQNLRGKQPRFFMGYPSWLYTLAKVALLENIRDVRLSGALSLGDKLFTHYRDAVREAFGVEVNDTYGTAEGMTVAAEFHHDGVYHMLTPLVYVELLDDAGQPVPDGQIGRVVVTKLYGKRMPLIRFDTGDLSSALPRDEYPARRPFELPLLKQVVGRNTDIIWTPEGRALIVHFFTKIMPQFPTIEQFKAVQKEPGGMEIHFVPRHDFDEAILKDVEASLRKPLQGERFGIDFVRVEEIKPTPSGKPQIVEVRMQDRTVIPAAGA